MILMSPLDDASVGLVEPLMKRGKPKPQITKRVAWSIKETTALCQGVIEYAGPKWAQISTAAELKQRTNVHCKDRMRVLMKQYESNDILDVAERWINEYNQTDE
jgi:hypothetical protein